MEKRRSQQDFGNICRKTSLDQFKQKRTECENELKFEKLHNKNVFRPFLNNLSKYESNIAEKVNFQNKVINHNLDPSNRLKHYSISIKIK